MSNVQCPLSETNIKYEYSKTPIYRAPIYRKPRYISAIFFPQIVLNMNNCKLKQTKPRFTANPDLPRMFPFPQTLYLFLKKK